MKVSVASLNLTLTILVLIPQMCKICQGVQSFSSNQQMGKVLDLGKFNSDLRLSPINLLEDQTKILEDRNNNLVKDLDNHFNLLGFQKLLLEIVSDFLVIITQHSSTMLCLPLQQQGHGLPLLLADLLLDQHGPQPGGQHSPQPGGQHSHLLVDQLQQHPEDQLQQHPEDLLLLPAALRRLVAEDHLQTNRLRTSFHQDFHLQPYQTDPIPYHREMADFQRAIEMSLEDQVEMVSTLHSDLEGLQALGLNHPDQPHLQDWEETGQIMQEDPPHSDLRLMAREVVMEVEIVSLIMLLTDHLLLSTDHQIQDQVRDLMRDHLDLVRPEAIVQPIVHLLVLMYLVRVEETEG